MGQSNDLMLLLSQERVLLVEDLLESIDLIMSVFDLIYQLLIHLFNFINSINSLLKFTYSLISCLDDTLLLTQDLFDLKLHISLGSFNLLFFILLNFQKLAAKILDL